MHCTTCGALNVAGATRCGACGGALPPMPAAVPGYAPAVAAAPVPRPTGVTILGVFDFIGAGFAVLGALVMMAAFSVGGALMAGAGADGFGGFFAGLGILFGIIMLAFGALYGALGWGMMKGRNWARILQLGLAGLGLAGSALGLVSALGGMTEDAAAAGFVVWQLLWAGVAGFIVWYLLQPGVKRYFGA